MRNPITVYFTSALLLLSLTTTAIAEKTSDAADIMLQVDQRDTGRTQIADSTLILIDKKDRQRTRNLMMYSLETDDVEKSLIYFSSPSDVKGTAYMSFDWSDPTKEDDSWLYLPALQKIKRVASSEESGAFMGSDFSYADINGTDYDDYSYEMINESAPVDGHDCWVIRSTPKNQHVVDKTGYTGSTSWVRKDLYMVIQGKIDVERGKRTKYFSATEIEKINNIWTAKKLQMITTRNGKKEHASVFQFGDVVYNQQVDENLFTTQAMQRGM